MTQNTKMNEKEPVNRVYQQYCGKGVERIIIYINGVLSSNVITITIITIIIFIIIIINIVKQWWKGLMGVCTPR